LTNGWFSVVWEVVVIVVDGATVVVMVVDGATVVVMVVDGATVVAAASHVTGPDS
jgi:hypothetical protein